MLRLTFPILVLFLTFSCSEKPELLKNNDPNKYDAFKDIVWASPGGFGLTMDIYTPRKGEEPYPVLVIYHGGGWLINDKSIMDQMSKYLATNSKYVICNVNYRLLSDNDNTITLNQTIEDVFGAILWIKDNIADYKGDKTKIAVTGDSAGGHLTATIVNMGTHLSSSQFFDKTLRFNPSYLPKGETAEQVAERNGLEVQAAILSYGSFNIYQASLNGFEEIKNPFWIMSGSKARGIFGEAFNAIDNSEMYKAVSPIYNIPKSDKRKLPPQLLTVGTEDNLVTPKSVKDYIKNLESSGHNTQYWEYEGRSHAFLDSGSNFFIGSSFEEHAPQAIDVMINFLDTVFYPG